MKDISGELKAYFRSKGITQQQIADTLGVSQAYIGGLLRGEKTFGKKQAQKFHELYGFNTLWLLTGDGDMFPSSVNTINVEHHGNTTVTGEGNAVNGSTVNPGSNEIINRLLDELAEQRKQNQELIELLKTQINK